MLRLGGQFESDSQSELSESSTDPPHSGSMKYRTVVTLGPDEPDSTPPANQHWPGGGSDHYITNHSYHGTSCMSSIPSLGSSGTTTVISKPSFKIIPNVQQDTTSTGPGRPVHEPSSVQLNHVHDSIGPALQDHQTMRASMGHYDLEVEAGYGGHESPALGVKRTSASTSGVSSSSSSLDNHDSGLEDGACSPVEEITHRFYMLETPDTQPAPVQDEQHPFFLGSRDVRDPSTLHEMKIVSSKGTVRGYKNRVRAGIMSFLDQQDKGKNYKVLEKGKVVLYTTSMRIVRDTYEKCMRVKNILQTHMVQYEERDVFMSRENQREILERLSISKIDLPQVFADGILLGGATLIESMNETGELRRIFQHFKKVNRPTSCAKCGGYRYIPCTTCHGSKKSLHRNHFTEEFCALRCIACDENGLIRCDLCHSNSSPT